MLLELLYGKQTDSSPIRPMGELSGVLRSLIFLSCNARDTLDHLEVGGKPTNQPSGAAGSLQQNTDADQRMSKPSVQIVPNVEGTADEGDEHVHIDEDDNTPDQKENIELRLEVNDTSLSELSIQQIIGNQYWRQDTRDTTLLEMMKFYESRYHLYRTKKAEYDKFSRYLERNVGQA